MNDYYGVAFFVWSGLVFALGFGAGRMFRFQRQSDRKVSIVLEPEIEERWDAVKTMAFVLGVVMFASVMVYTVSFTYDQRQCNYDFYDRLQERADIATSDRRLLDQRDEATFNMVHDILAAPPGTGREVLNTFLIERERIDTAAAENEKKRTETPLPDCANRR